MVREQGRKDTVCSISRPKLRACFVYLVMGRVNIRWQSSSFIRDYPVITGLMLVFQMIDQHWWQELILGSM